MITKTNIDKEGNIKIETKFLPFEQGEKLKEQLEALKCELNSEEHELKAKYRKKLKDIASFYQG